MEMRSGPKVSGRSRRVVADQGWSLRGVPLYIIILQNAREASVAKKEPILGCPQVIWVRHKTKEKRVQKKKVSTNRKP